LDAAPRTKGFGNARAARNLFEAAISRHAGRVMKLVDPPSEEDLTTLEPEDLPDAIEDSS
jgi:hypothetical protein